MKTLDELLATAVSCAHEARATATGNSRFVCQSDQAVLAAAQVTATATILAALVQRDLVETVLSHLERANETQPEPGADLPSTISSG